LAPGSDVGISGTTAVLEATTLAAGEGGEGGVSPLRSLRWLRLSVRPAAHSRAAGTHHLMQARPVRRWKLGRSGACPLLEEGGELTAGTQVGVLMTPLVAQSSGNEPMMGGSMPAPTVPRLASQPGSLALFFATPSLRLPAKWMIRVASAR